MSENVTLDFDVKNGFKLSRTSTVDTETHSETPLQRWARVSTSKTRKRFAKERGQLLGTILGSLLGIGIIAGLVWLAGLLGPVVQLLVVAYYAYGNFWGSIKSFIRAGDQAKMDDGAKYSNALLCQAFLSILTLAGLILFAGLITIPNL